MHERPDRVAMNAALDALMNPHSGLPKMQLRLLAFLSSEEAMKSGLSYHDIFKKTYGRDAKREQEFRTLRVYLSKLRRRLKEFFGEHGEKAKSAWYCSLLDAHTGGKMVGASDHRYLLEWRRTTSASASVSERVDEGFWIAVLPFRSSCTQVAPLAGGLTEEVTTGLARFSYLHVVARGSANQAVNRDADMRVVGRLLGARYLMEGSLQKSGTRVRVSVQLVDAVTGTQLWADTYERTLHAESVFEIQDELVPRIVATVASGYGGVLCRAISQVARRKPLETLTAYESLMRAFSYYDRITPAEHALVRAELELAIYRYPSDADLHAILSSLYLDEFRYGFNPLPDPLGRAHKHAQRAVDLSPTSYLAHQMLSSTHFYRRDFAAFREELSAVLRLNLLDQSSTATMAYLLCCSGDVDAGMALWKRCSDWTDSPPGWFWIIPYFDCYRRKDYVAALAALHKVNMPGTPRYQAYLAAVYGQLGDRHGAGEAVSRLLEIQPNFDAGAEFRNTFEGELLQPFLDGLQKAGVDVSASNRAKA